MPGQLSFCNMHLHRWAAFPGATPGAALGPEPRTGWEDVRAMSLKTQELSLSPKATVAFDYWGKSRR
jgi:hypothetical protein